MGRLYFRYDQAGRWIIEDLSLELRAGAPTALLGPTGTGKSSLVNVLLRFWEFERGTITLDGRDIRSLSGEEVRRNFTVAPQISYLFHTTIRENLAVAAPDADDRRLFEALRLAALDDFVGTLPDGLQTVVGETGLRLSAGQARRLIVARALLKPAPILVLDEPTEGLDDASAGRLLQGVFSAAASQALLVISHRERDRRMCANVVTMPAAGARPFSR